MIEETGSEESDESLEELLKVIVARQTIDNSGKKQRQEYKHRPFRDTEFGEEKRHVQNENQVGQVELKRYFEKHV